MSKKKKKKKSISILNEVDKTLDHTYDNIIDEIEEMQLQLYLADQEARKKAKKKIKKDPNYFDTSIERLEARKSVLTKIEGNNLLTRIENIFKDIAPIVVIISRLIASLILAILSLDRVKLFIKPETLNKLSAVYKTATSIS